MEPSGTDAVLAGAVLFPSALAIGATFPFAVRALARNEAEAGIASARVYAWNTVGAIVGAVAGGFFLIPALGFAGAATLAVGANLFLSCAAAWKVHGRPGWLGGFALGGLVLLGLSPPSPPWVLLRTTPFSPEATAGEVVFQATGRNASVLLLENRGEWLLRMNGLPESAVQPEGARAQRYSVAHWLGALPSILRPGLESLLVVGLGGGIALEGIPPSVRSIDVIEIEREALRANHALADRRRHDPLSDPRVRVHINDARNGLLLAQRRFEAIVSQPSHPWTSGSAHLYTREFFELVRSRLTSEGVFVQWMGLRFVDEPLLRTLVATLRDVFPHVRAFRPPQRPALLFAASAAPFPNRQEIARGMDGEAGHFARLGLSSVSDLEAAWVLAEDGVQAFAGDAPVNRDGHNLLETRSPRVARTPRTRSPLRALAGFDPLPRRIREDQAVAMIRRLTARGELSRARRLVRLASEGTERVAARALVSVAAGSVERAERQLELTLEGEPRHAEARAALLRLKARRATTSVPPIDEPLSALERACWEGWQKRRSGQWEKLRAFDATLASADPEHPLYGDAARLRAWWRVASENLDLAREALALIDPVLATSQGPRGLMLRAEAALLAGYSRGTVSTLAELVEQWPGPTRQGGIVARIRALLTRLPSEPPFSQWKRSVEIRLETIDALSSQPNPP
jgi:hypothetical protein